MTGTESAADRIDTSKPHPARVYDWFLGGKDNYPVDEQLGQHIMSIDPGAKRAARSNRWFMQRATRHLVRAAGIRQFLDVGTGIPTEPNLHQIAQITAPDARVVYVDNDPIVLAHAEALLRGTPEGVTEYIQADAREPRKILEEAGHILDFDRPIALSLIALLHFIADESGAYELVDTLLDALAPGSCLVLSALTADFEPENVRRGIDVYSKGGVTLVGRSHAEVSRSSRDLTWSSRGSCPRRTGIRNSRRTRPRSATGRSPCTAASASRPDGTVSEAEVLLNWGEVHVEAGTASLLIAAAPVFSVLLGSAFLAEPVTRTVLVGSAVALGGTAAVTLADGTSGFTAAALVVLAAALVQGVYHFATKPLLRRYTGLEVATYAMAAGTVLALPLLPATVRTVPHASGGALASAVFLGLLPSALGFVIWGYAVARLPLATSTAALYLVPPVALLVSFAWLGEVPHPVELVGGAITVLGVALINKSKDARADLRQPSADRPDPARSRARSRA